MILYFSGGLSEIPSLHTQRRKYGQTRKIYIIKSKVSVQHQYIQKVTLNGLPLWTWDSLYWNQKRIIDNDNNKCNQYKEVYKDMYLTFFSGAQHVKCMATLMGDNICESVSIYYIKSVVHYFNFVL